jgi:glycosyltransferase involved in cell wall biosynthesis
VLKVTNPIFKKQQGRLRQLLRTALYKWAFSRAAQVLVLGRHSERQIADNWPAAAAKVRFVHNPYVTHLSASAEVERPRDTVPKILSVGRLTPQKNHALLLRALARVADLRWRLVLLGEGPLRSRLCALAEELGIAERVEFRGFVADPTPFYSEAHVLALSSDWEDLPAVVLEALAAGVPVVSTACSEALTDVMREANHGQLTAPGDVAAFASALRQLIMHPLPRTPFEGARRYSIANGINDHAAALQLLLNCSTGHTGKPRRRGTFAR